MANDFLSGFERTFSPSFQRGIDRAIAQENADRQYALQQAAERRAQGLYDVQMADRARVNQAFDAYEAAQAGITPDQQTGLRQTYGMNPSQVATGLRQGGMSGLQGQLAGFDQPDNFDLQNAPAVPGMRLQAQAPSRLQNEQALGRIATAQRDVQGMRASQTAQLGIQGDEIVAKRLRGNLDPAELDKVAGFINQNDDVLTLGDPDKNGFRQMSFVKPNGKSSFVSLSPLEQRRLLAANDLMDIDPKRAFELIGSVNSELAKSLQARNEMTMKLGEQSNLNAYRGGQLSNERDRIGVARGELGLRQRQMREMDPKDVAALNDLNARISAEADPQKRRLMQQEYQRLYGIAATKIGKVVNPQIDKSGGLKFQNTGDGSGFFQDESGRPVGNYAAGQGMTPFGPSPTANPEIMRMIQRGSLDVIPVQDEGGVRWGYRSPRSGRVFDNPQEALMDSQNQAGAGRGIRNPAAVSTPSSMLGEEDIYPQGNYGLAP